MNPFLQHDYNPRHGFHQDLRSNMSKPQVISEIEDVLQEVRQGWEFMLDDEFDPVTLALALMDESSVGKSKDFEGFQRLLHNLDDVLTSIVEDYYDGFDKSIRTSGAVLQRINDSHNRVENMKLGLQKSNHELLEKRTDLLTMWSKSQQHKEMLQFLETIDDLRTTPEKVDNLVSEKHVLKAATILEQAIKTAHNSDMSQIGALDDVRRILENQKNKLFDMLMEELHIHIYLKNSYCNNRWTEYQTGQQELPISSTLPRSFSERQSKSKDTGDEVKNMFVYSEEDIIIEDTEKNPETDSYYYMEIIMEALAVLGQMPTTLETIQERLPLEIHTLIDKTISEVEQRYPGQSFVNERRTKDTDDYAMFSLDKANQEASNEVLADLLWTLFSKMEAVLRGNRFVEMCARRINERNSSNSSSDDTNQTFKVYQFHDLWVPVQAEIRSLLQDYLTSQDRTTASIEHPEGGLGSGRPTMGGLGQSKQLFKFSEGSLEPGLADGYRFIGSYLQMSFRKQISGYTITSTNKPEQGIHSSIVDRFASGMASKGHRLLVKPDGYNVSVLVKPTMAFLQRVKEIFPNYDDQSEGDFASFLDDFAINVFLPQIEEKVMQLVYRATSGFDAFQNIRDYKNYSQHPIIKSAVALISIIQGLCRTMNSMPIRKEEYVRLMEVVLLKFYEKCYHKFHATISREKKVFSSTEVSTDEAGISTSGDWAHDEGLVGLLTQNPYFNDAMENDEAFSNTLNQAEIAMEFRLKGSRRIEANELIFDSKRLIMLGRLYHSLKWFVHEIWELRTHKSDVPQDNSAMSSAPESFQATSSRRWSRSDWRKSYQQDSTPTGGTHLSLQGDTADRFDALLTTYQKLAETCLFSLRLEGRCHTMYYLELAIQEGNYYLEDETCEPDPYVLALNEDLVELDECTNASLPRKDEMFVFDGIPAMIVDIFISNAIHIKRMNENGAKKMIRNVLAIQQNIGNFVPLSQSTTLERVREYFTLFNIGSESLIRSIRDNGPTFSFDEYRVLLSLMNDVNRDGEDITIGPGHEDQGRNNSTAQYSEWLMKLDDVMDQHET